MTKVLFFGSLGDRFGREREVAMPPEGVTVAALRDLIACSPEEAAWLRAPGVRAAAGQQLVQDSDLVRPNQEIAFFSPVSGG